MNEEVQIIYWGQSRSGVKTNHRLRHAISACEDNPKTKYMWIFGSTKLRMGVQEQIDSAISIGLVSAELVENDKSIVYKFSNGSLLSLRVNS